MPYDGAWEVGTPPELSDRFLTAKVMDELDDERRFEDMSRLRKLTSLRYLRRKMRGWLRPEHRDTIVCEDDEEATLGRRNIYDIIRWDDRSGIDLSTFGAPSPGHRCSAPVPVAAPPAYEPSREQRWCINCSKCFQRKLSHYENFCGLDCKTAHRFRQCV